MIKGSGVVSAVEKGDCNTTIVVDTVGGEVFLSSQIGIMERRKEKQRLEKLYNSCYVGDIVEYERENNDLPNVLVRNITAETGIVTSRVVESNPISQLPMLQDTLLFQGHVVLLNNARWGDFVMTPVNTFPSVDKIHQGYNLYQKKFEYLPELIRFCNLKSGDHIKVSHHPANGLAGAYSQETHLSEFVYVVRKWAR